MKWWHVLALVLVLAGAVMLWSMPAGPKTVKRVEIKPIHGNVSVVVFSEDGREVNAHVWREGQFWCAEAAGFLPDCVKEKGKAVKITLRRDPGDEVAELNVIGCAFLAYAPVGSVPIGPVPCGVVKVKKGLYRFVFFAADGYPLESADIFVAGDMEYKVREKRDTTQPAKLKLLDAGTGKAFEAWVSVPERPNEKNADVLRGMAEYALRAREVNVFLPSCSFVSTWAEGHGRASPYICPGQETNVAVPVQVGGAQLIVAAPGADRIVVSDRAGSAIYTVADGDEAVFKNTPPGAYAVEAWDGASVTRKKVDVEGGQQVVEIETEGGNATIVTEKQVQVFALGRKVAEGTGRLIVPARTVLHVVILERPPREEVMVLLPGEERVI